MIPFTETAGQIPFPCVILKYQASPFKPMVLYEVLERVQEFSGEWKIVRFWTGKYGIVDPYGDIVDPLDAPIGARNLLYKYQR